MTPFQSNSVLIRPALASDAIQATACVRAAYVQGVPLIGRKPWPMLQDYSEVIKTQQVFIAQVFGKFAGVLVLMDTADGFLLDNVAVLPSYKGQGVGKCLLIHAEQQAKLLGRRSIYLYTNEKMVANINLYAKVGYVEFERRAEQGFARVFMRKILD